jgi:transposase
MIRISSHTTKFAHQSKRNNLRLFLDEYRRMAQVYLDYLWDHPNIFNGKTLDVTNQKYDCPTFLTADINTKLNTTTTLSARALKCCSTQVCGIVKAVLEKPRKRLYILTKLTKEHQDVTQLRNKITKHPITKPVVKGLKAELNSICCDYRDTQKYFNGYLQLHALGKTFGKIRVPIKHHRQSRKWCQGILLKSFLVSEDTINFRWELAAPKERTAGIILGADQGYKTVVTLSNGVITQQQDRHGHTLETITKRLTRKTKGSKAFGRTQQHRKNFINWSVNHLNLDNVKQLNLEKIVNIGYKRRQSRLMSHWNNTLIRDKLQKVCEENGVRLVLQTSVYRSQRCFNCGLVRKSNRKGKLYTCKTCGYESDADLNAAKNHAILLPELPFGLRNLKLNIKGFLWKETGVFNLDGTALTVPFSTTKADDIKS